MNCDSRWENESDVGLWWYNYTYTNLIYWIVKATWGGMVEYKMMKYMHMYWCEKYEKTVCKDWAPRPEIELGRESRVWLLYIYIHAHVRSETELGRESQEWLQKYKKEKEGFLLICSQIYKDKVVYSNRKSLKLFCYYWNLLKIEYKKINKEKRRNKEEREG